MVISVVAGAEPPAKRDKLAIIHKLVAFTADLRLCRLSDLVRSGSRAVPPIGWIVQVEWDTEAGLQAT